jgi:RNA polymerase sigma factor (sigma-70 family)
MPTRHDRPASNMAAGPAEADDASVIAWSREEPAQFAEIFHRYAPEVQRYVVRRLGSDAADDVVAETFLTAFRQRDGYDTSRACARPWLYGIASHMISRHRRAEIRGYRLLARTGSDPVIAPFTDEVDAAVSAGAARRPLAAALARLPAGQRDALLLVTWSELTYAQAAEALGVPVGTLRSRVHRARARLRRTLSDIAPAILDKELPS